MFLLGGEIKMVAWYKRAWKFVNKNGSGISALIAILIFFGFQRFNIFDFWSYYSELSSEGKIIITFFANLIITVCLFYVAVRKKD